MKISNLLLMLLLIVPFIITQLIICYNLKNYNHKWVKSVYLKGSLSSLILNILTTAILFIEIFPDRDLALVIRKFLSQSCSYQDIGRLGTVNFLSLCIAVFIGLGIYRLLYKRFPVASKKEKGIFLLLMTFILLPIIGLFIISYQGTGNLTITEICRNIEWEEEEIGKTVNYYDAGYVDITNIGEFPCETKGLCLCDNEDEQNGIKLDTVTILPGESYRFVMEEQESLSIKKSGGSTIYLFNSSDDILDKVLVPALEKGEVYRLTDENWLVCDAVTNEGDNFVEPPTFSVTGGFYSDPVSVSLSSAPGTTIHYTLDCSTPSSDSPTFAEPILAYDRSSETNQYCSLPNLQLDYLNEPVHDTTPVAKCFVIRAVAVDSDGDASSIVTESYFINQEKYADSMVVSLVSDPEGLFSDETGICVTGATYDTWYEATVKSPDGFDEDDPDMPTANFQQRGRDWERAANMEVYSQSVNTLNQQIGIRIQGRGSRKNTIKRFSLYSRKDYSQDAYFDVNLVNEYAQHDLFTRRGNLHAISQKIGEGRNVATMDFQKVSVFLDGEFWNNTYLYEKLSERNLAEKYGLSHQNIAIAKDYAPDSSTEEGAVPYSLIHSYLVNHDLSNPECYDAYNEIMDIQSYIDYSCIQTFLQNNDYHEKNNYLCWHTIIAENSEKGDTRWHFGLYDMDLVWLFLAEEFGEMEAYQQNPFTMYSRNTAVKAPITEWPIFSALRQNETFCRQFVLTYMDLLNTNFSTENTLGIMRDLGVTRQEYTDFFTYRPAYIVQYLAEEFELTGTQETVTLSSNLSGEPVTLNTITPTLSEFGAWSGTYFTDYPITVTVNAEGFDHWEITANGQTKVYSANSIEVPVTEGGVQIYAVFQ